MIPHLLHLSRKFHILKLPWKGFRTLLNSRQSYKLLTT